LHAHHAKSRCKSQAPPPGAAHSAVRPSSAGLPAPQSNAGGHVQAPPPGAAPGRSETHWGRPPSPPRVEGNSPPDRTAAPPPASGSAQPHWGRGNQAPPPSGPPSVTYGRSEPHWGQPPSPRVESNSRAERSAP